MRRYLGIIIGITLALGAFVALSAAGNLDFDRPPENEREPIRSSYNSGPTGTRAFYQLLEESGTPIVRLREDFKSLSANAPNPAEAMMIVVGPFNPNSDVAYEEAAALQKWIAEGGNALIVSRYPISQFGDPMVQSRIQDKNPPWTAPTETLIDPASDSLIVQPTELTRNVRGLELTTLAARIKFEPPDIEEDEEESSPPPPSPTATPEAVPDEPVEQSDEDRCYPFLYAPVIHLGDKNGAVLADFRYCKGRLVFLSDPFVIANNGIARGANLTLAMNLVRTLGKSENGQPRKIIFDEFHHGYRSQINPLVNYVRGTPVPWLLLQGLLLSLLIVVSVGKRFARPLPMPQEDRHSPLEFVGSMANLQQIARARDLALENIYPRFKATLCRRLGLSSRAKTEEIVASLRRQNLPLDEIEVRQTLSDAEVTLAGEKIDDAQLVKLVGRMRRILAQLKK
ncbi:MAG: DUF4350 domain-containing protein [Acidobacteriota bacterium]|nr:DUF4350 domain-containing protein [Acidobacteriota bacterium]